MDEQTIENIGYAYNYAKQIDEYCYNCKEIRTLGISLTHNAAVDEAVAKVLFDLHLNFQIVLKGDDLSKFDKIIMPDEKLLDDGEIISYNNFLSIRR